MRPHPHIGQELVAARAAGVRWKALSKRYGLSRSRLYQLWSKAAGRGTGPVPRGCSCPNCGFALISHVDDQPPA